MATAKSTIELNLNLDSSNASKGVQDIEKNTTQLLNNFSTLQKSALAFNKELQKTNNDLSQLNKNGILKGKFTAAQKAAVDFNSSVEQLSKHLNLVQSSVSQISGSKFIDAAAKQRVDALSESFVNIKNVASTIQPINLTEGNITNQLQDVFKSSNELKNSINEIRKSVKELDGNIQMNFSADFDGDLSELKKLMLGEDVYIDFNSSGLDDIKKMLSDIEQSFDSEIEIEVDGVGFQKKITDILDTLDGKKVDIDFDSSGSKKFEGELDKINKAIEEVKKGGGKDISDFSDNAQKELKDVQKEAKGTGGAFGSLGGVLSGLADSVPGLSGIGDTIGGIGEKLSGLGGSGGGGLLSSLGGAGGALAVTGIGAAVAGAAVAIGAGVSQINEDVSKLRETRKMVFQFTGLSGQALNDAAAEVQSLANAYGVAEESITESMTAIAGNRDLNMTEAADFLNEALASGFDEEQLNQLREYDIQFKKAGLSLEDSIDAIRIGTEEGIYDDKFPDSIKEFGLRLNELSTDTEMAKKRLAPLGNEFFNTFQKDLESGSISTVEAAQRIFDRMDDANLSSGQRETIIADLFGGAGEDAGRLGEAFNRLNNPITSLIENNDELTQSFENTFSKINDQLQSGTADFSDALAPLGEEFAEQFNKSVSEGRDTEKLINDVINESIAQGYSAEAAENIALSFFPPESVANAKELVSQIAKQAEETGKVTRMNRQLRDAEQEYQQKLADTQLQQQQGFSQSLDFAKTKVMSVFLDIYNSIVGDTVGGIGDIIFNIADNITEITDPIVEYVGMVVDNIKVAFGLVGDIFSAIGSIIEPIIEIFTTAEDTTEGIKKEGDGVKNVMSIIGDVIQTIVDRLRVVFSVLKVVFTILGTVAKVVGTIVGAVVRWTVKVLKIREIFTGITNIFNDIKQAIAETFSDRNNPIVKFFERTYNMVRRIVNKLGGDLQTFDELMGKLSQKEEKRDEERKKRRQDTEGDNISGGGTGGGGTGAEGGTPAVPEEEKRVEIEVVADTTKMIDSVTKAKDEVKQILTDSATETIQYEQDIELMLNPVNSVVEGIVSAEFDQSQAFQELEDNINNAYDLVEDRRKEAEDKVNQQYEAGLDKIIGSARNAEQIQKRLSDSAEVFDSQIVEAFEAYQKASENATDAEKSELFDNFISQREQILENKKIDRDVIIESANLSKEKREELHQLNIQRTIAEAEVQKAFIDDRAAAEEVAAAKRAALERKQQQQQVLQYTRVLQEQQAAAEEFYQNSIEQSLEFSKQLSESMDLDNESNILNMEFKFNRQNIQDKLDEELVIMQNSLNRFANTIGIDIPVGLSAGEEAEFLQNQIGVLEDKLTAELPNLTETEAKIRRQQIDVLRNLLNQRTAIIANKNNEILAAEVEYLDQLNTIRDEQIAEQRKAFDKRVDEMERQANEIFDLVKSNESLVESIVNDPNTQALGGVVDGARATLVGLRSFANDLLSMTSLVRQGFDSFQDIKRNTEDTLQALDDSKEKLEMIDEALVENAENIANSNGELKKTFEEKRKMLLEDRKATVEYIKSIEGNTMELEQALADNQKAIEEQKKILEDPSASEEAKNQAENRIKELESNSSDIRSQIEDNMKKLKRALAGDWKAIKELAFDGAQALTKAVFGALQKASAATVESLDRVIAKQEERVAKIREGLEEGGEAARNLTAEQLEIEEARLQKAEEQRREELQKQRNFTTAQIALQGAIAIARAFATIPPPLSFVVAAATAATLFAQIAAVRSRAQGAAQAEHGATVLEGGKIRQRGKNGGGTLQGRRHSTGGVLIEAEDGEDIMSRKVTHEFRDILDMMHDGKIKRKDLMLSKDVKKMNISELIQSKTFNDKVFNKGSINSTPIIINNNMDKAIFEGIQREITELRMDIKRNSRTNVDSYIDGKKITDVITKKQKKKDIIKNKAKRK